MKKQVQKIILLLSVACLFLAGCSRVYSDEQRDIILGKVENGVNVILGSTEDHYSFITPFVETSDGKIINIVNTNDVYYKVENQDIRDFLISEIDIDDFISESISFSSSIIPVETLNGINDVVGTVELANYCATFTNYIKNDNNDALEDVFKNILYERNYDGYDANFFIRVFDLTGFKDANIYLEKMASFKGLDFEIDKGNILNVAFSVGTIKKSNDEIKIEGKYELDDNYICEWEYIYDGKTSVDDVKDSIHSDYKSGNLDKNKYVRIIKEVVNDKQ